MQTRQVQRIREKKVLIQIKLKWDRKDSEVTVVYEKYHSDHEHSTGTRSKGCNREIN